MSAGRIRVGIGGWIFEPWRGTFFPPGLPKTQELAYASRHVTAIEVNATFYRTQTPQTFRRWADTAPDDFAFALKASRYATNRKDLADGAEAVARFVESGITELGDKLGPILWQLAPTKRFAATEMEGFFGLLPKAIDGRTLRHVVEVRHASFVDPEFVTLARARGVTICLSLHADYPMIVDQTGAVAYLRLQTTSEEVETGYDAATIAAWASHAERLAAGKTVPALEPLIPDADARPRDCYVFFIGGGKPRNPAAAAALLDVLASMRPER